MRKLCLCLTTLPWLSALAVACVSSSGGPGGGGTNFPDSGGTEFDSSVEDSTTDVSIAEAAADTSVHDGSPADTSSPQVDAAVDAGALVTLTVVGQFGPEANVPVVFASATGAVLATIPTSASGIASFAAPSGGQVTAVMGSATSPLLLTIQGIEPGDSLTALDATFVAGQVSINSVPASVPDAGDGGTLNFSVFAGPCATTFPGPPVGLQLNQGCVNGTTFPVLVVAAGIPQTAFAFQKGNMLPLDGGTAQVDVGGSWSTATTTQTVAATSVPASWTPGSLVFSEGADGVLESMANGYLLANDGGSAPFQAHPGYPDFVQAEANVLLAGGMGASFGAIATRSAPPASSGTTSFDLSQLPPQITGYAIDSTTVVAQPTLTWTSAAPLGSVTQGAIATMGWFGTTDSGASVNGTWTIVAPSSATSIQAPALPSSVAGWAPEAGASYGVPTLEFVQASFYSGYAQLRAGAAAFPAWSLVNGSQAGSAIVPPLPAAGTLILTAFAMNPS